MATSSKKKKKTKRGALVVPRGGFTTGMPWSRFKAIGRAKIERELRDAGLDLSKVSRVLKSSTFESAAKVAGKVAVGMIQDSVSDYFGKNTTDKVPFMISQDVKSKSIGSVNVKVHHTKFEYGNPSSRALKRVGKENGVTKRAIVDTMRDYKPGTAERDHLTMNCGFNEKIIACHSLMQHGMNKLGNEFQIDDYLTPGTKLQDSYVGTLNLWREIKIMNTNRYLKGTYKVRFWRRLDNYNPAASLMESTHTKDEITFNSNQPGKIPVYWSLVGNINDGYSEGAAKAWVDPAVSLNKAPNWKTKYEEVKSFTKVLGPGDVWNIKDIYHCGPGIHMGRFQRDRLQHTYAATGLVWTIEAYGQEVQACYAANLNENFIGKAPCYFQLECKLGHETVIAGQNIYETDPTSGIFHDRYYVRSFTQYPSKFDRIYHVSPADIVDDPSVTIAGKLFIPVMTDSILTYSERKREGGTGGDERTP